MEDKIETSDPRYRKALRTFNNFVTEASRANRPISQVLKIDPAMASVMLDHNVGNRNIRRAKLTQYKRDLQARRWQLNGETLIVAQDGTMNDGQHRLRAIAETGVSMEAVVVFGVSKDSMKTVDSGAGRSASDVMGFRGISNSHTVASMTRIILGFERSNPELNERASTLVIGNHNDFSVAEIVERYESATQEEQELMDRAASFGTSNNRPLRGRLTPQLSAFCYWLLGSKDEVAAEAMLKRLSNEMGFHDKDPIYHLHRNLKRMDDASLSRRVEAVVRTWNAIRRGREVSRLHIMDVIPAVKS